MTAAGLSPSFGLDLTDPASVLVGSDLDRTLVYSAAAVALPEGATADSPRLVCVEVCQGMPLSFMTTRATSALAALARRLQFVPVTTRTPEQYRRIRFPEVAPRYAVTANGGQLLVNGIEDLDWSAHVRRTLAAASVPLVEVAARLGSFADADFVEKVGVASDLFTYAVVSRSRLPETFVADLTGWCAERGWTVFLQGRKVYLMPSPLTKSAALREVADRVGARTILTAGDSLLDADLLEAGDHAIRPRHGALADAGYTGRAARPVAVTRGRGVLAGEEIVDWFAARAAAVVAGTA